MLSYKYVSIEQILISRKWSFALANNATSLRKYQYLRYKFDICITKSCC